MNNQDQPQLNPSSKFQKELTWFFAIIVAVFAGLYLFNISGWLIHDDEGTDLYEAWQLSIGNQPGVDFIAEQQPLFLTIGQSLLRLSEDSATAVRYVRLASAIQVLAGAIFLGLVVKRLWDVPTAVLTVGITLISGLVLQQARMYRPDPMMFAWEMFGLGFVLLAVKLGKRPYWGAAGAAYGIAVLMKLFGLFPVVGLVFFFSYQFIKYPKEWQNHLRDGITFAIPFLLISGGLSFILYGKLGFYYQEVFNQHLSIGQEKTLWEQIATAITEYLGFILYNFIIIFIIFLALMNRRSGEKTIHVPEKALFYTQILAPAIFVLMTRPIYPRYYIFLTPIFALLLALQLQGFFNKLEEHRQVTVIKYLVILMVIGFSGYLTFPRIAGHFGQEQDTIALAKYIQTLTTPDDVVLSDYAGLNFHAKRPSIYEASIIAEGRIVAGIITGELLIERMEETQTELVLVHVDGGEPHLIHLVDFDLFQAHLNEKYQLIDTFNRQDQQIEIYQRR
ncbi:ArnT family glycosyltransferase [Candidatus Leptofilum sp.]|uniref:ArnT family glycosyltransferase n=1 Tax=Candidatus Leptofilum sp. TaxID=3241576 RepID=UPI003B5C5237